MKQHKKSQKNSRFQFDDYEEDEMPAHTSHKKDGPRRRPVRNWKKAWTNNEKNYDEIDDFFGK